MGLLDNAFGNGWDDPRSQMMMGLAQGLLSARGGAGLAAGLGNMQSVQQNIGKKKLMDMQLANYQSEIDARKLATMKFDRQQAVDAQFMGTGGGSGEYASNQSAGGAPSVGQGGEGFTAAGIAKQFGLPIEVVISDYKFNGGKKIAELIDGRSKPNWQNVNGNLVNTNAQGFGGGMQAGMSASADGKVTAWQPDGSGGLVVGAPRGSMETYGAYKGIDAGLGAAAKVNLRKNADGTESPVSELTENPTLLGMIGGQRPAGAPSVPGVPQHYLNAVVATESGGNPNAVSPKGARGVMQVMPSTNTAPGFGVTPARDGSEAERTRVGVEYLGKMQERYQDPTLAAIAYNWGPGNTDMWLKGGGDYSKLPKETRDYVSSVMTRAAVGGRGQPPQQAPATAPAYGMTNEQVIANKVNETRLVDTAKGQTSQELENNQKGNQFTDYRQQLKYAENLLKAGPTSSWIGNKADQAYSLVGGTSASANLSKELETVSAGLVSNVPKAPGSQSNFELEQYKIQAGNAGDATLPIPQRLASLKAANRMIDIWESRVKKGEQAPQAGVIGSWGDKPAAAPATKAPQPMKGMVRGGYKFKGGDPSDKANWEAM